MENNMEAPERIWADRTGIEGAVEIGCWADTVRYMGGVEYIRADLAAPSAQYRAHRNDDGSFSIADDAGWLEGSYVRAPSAPAEVEGLVELWPSSSTSAFGDNQRWVRSKDYAALQARAEKAEAERDALMSDMLKISVAVQEIYAKLKGDV